MSVATETGVLQPAVGQESNSSRQRLRLVAVAGLTVLSLAACERLGGNQSTDGSPVREASSSAGSSSSSGSQVPDVTLAHSCDVWDKYPEAIPKLESTLARIAATDITGVYAPGAAIEVGCGNKALFGFGIGSTGDGHEVSASDTEYDLASVSKSFTAATVFMLDQQGKLKLDEPVGDFLSAFKRGEKSQVTFRMLLEHRAGFHDPNYTHVTNGNYGKPGVVWQNVLETPLTYAPGSQYEYSNYGFNVAFAAAAAAAGIDVVHDGVDAFGQYIKTNLLEPLGMTHSGYYTGPGSLTNCAPSSVDEDQTTTLKCIPQDNLARFEGNLGGHAGWFTTADDMAKFAEMVANGGEIGGRRILTDAQLRLMQTSVGGKDYGVGAMTNNDHFYFGDKMSRAALGHTGWNGTQWSYDPKSGLWSTVLTNGTFHAPAPQDKSYSAYRKINDALVTATDALR